MASTFSKIYTKSRSRKMALTPLADPDIRLGAMDPDIRQGGQFNVLRSSVYLTFISSLEGAKIYSQTGWEHGRMCPLDPPLLTLTTDAHGLIYSRTINQSIDR